jgi:hypothetical protein
MSEHLEDELVDEADPEIVHWMQPKRVALGPGAASAAAAGAFALGVVATLAAIALAHWLQDEEHLVRLRRRADV